MIVHLRFLFPFHGKSDKERYPSSMNKESQHWTIITPFIIVHILCGLWYISPFGSIFTLISSHSSLEIFFFCSLSQNKDGKEKNIRTADIENRAESESNWLFFHIRIFRLSRTSKQSFYLQMSHLSHYYVPYPSNDLLIFYMQWLRWIIKHNISKAHKRN